MAQVIELCRQSQVAIEAYRANRQSFRGGEAPAPQSPPIVNNTTSVSINLGTIYVRTHQQYRANGLHMKRDHTWATQYTQGMFAVHP